MTNFTLPPVHDVPSIVRTRHAARQACNPEEIDRITPYDIDAHPSRHSEKYHHGAHEEEAAFRFSFFAIFCFFGGFLFNLFRS